MGDAPLDMISGQVAVTDVYSNNPPRWIVRNAPETWIQPEDLQKCAEQREATRIAAISGAEIRNSYFQGELEGRADQVTYQLESGAVVALT